MMTSPHSLTPHGSAPAASQAPAKVSGTFSCAADLRTPALPMSQSNYAGFTKAMRAMSSAFAVWADA